MRNDLGLGSWRDGSDSTENSSENNNSQNSTNTGENKSPRCIDKMKEKIIKRCKKINNNRSMLFNEEPLVDVNFWWFKQYKSQKRSKAFIIQLRMASGY